MAIESISLTTALSKVKTNIPPAYKPPPVPPTDIFALTLPFVQNHGAKFETESTTLTTSILVPPPPKPPISDAILNGKLKIVGNFFNAQEVMLKKKSVLVPLISLPPPPPPPVLASFDSPCPAGGNYFF